MPQRRKMTWTWRIEITSKDKLGDTLYESSSIPSATNEWKMDDEEACSTNSCFHAWFGNGQMLFFFYWVSYIQIAHEDLPVMNKRGSDAHSKYFSISVHHKIVVLISVAGELMKVHDLLLRWVGIRLQPFVKPFSSLYYNIFIVKGGWGPDMWCIAR